MEGEMIFRQMERQHVDGLVQGASMMIRPLAYYRLLEAATGDSAIGDSEESTQINRLGHAKFNTGDLNPEAQRLMNLGMIKRGPHATGTTNVTLNNIRLIRQVECHVSCWTLGTASKRPNLANYDTTVRLKSVDRFCDLLWHTGVEKAIGRRIQDMFSAIEHGPIQYNAEEIDLATMNPGDGDPFRKRSRYADQAEYRFVFHPAAPIPGDYLFISYQPDPNIFEIEIHNARPPSDSPPVPDRDFADELRKLRMLWRLRYVQADDSHNNDWRRYLELEEHEQGEAWRRMNGDRDRRHKAIDDAFDAKFRADLKLCIFRTRDQARPTPSLDRAVIADDSTSTLMFLLEAERPAGEAGPLPGVG